VLLMLVLEVLLHRRRIALLLLLLLLLLELMSLDVWMLHWRQALRQVRHLLQGLPIHHERLLLLLIRHPVRYTLLGDRPWHLLSW